MRADSELTRRCPALFVSAPASNQGKTTVTAALARLHASLGRTVRVFKTGPDFLDPMILERAAGQPVYQLDLWMGSEAHCRDLLFDAAGTADLILIEGMMGLFDGAPSSADLAQRFGVPVLLVIDAEAMAQTFGAVAHGLTHYRDGLSVRGVVANRVAGERHAELVKEGVRAGVPFLGSLSRDAQLELPARHLGLVQAEEVLDLEQRLAAAARLLQKSALTELPPAVEFCATDPATAQSPASPLPPLLAGVRVGVARDRAFSFVYHANLDVLRAMGAEIVFFSPLVQEELPTVDSLYLPGGYPELHVAQLGANRAMVHALRVHIEANKPVYAECGGMLYLLESLTDVRGHSTSLAGILPGHVVMHERLRALGYQTAPLPGGAVRGHTFHYSTIETPMRAAAYAERHGNPAPGEPIYQQGRVVASYFHGYFPSNPLATAQLFAR